MLSKREWLARQLFATYLPRDRVVYGVRPDWLVNPTTHQALEVDILYPDLKLAIEVDGGQHHRYTPGLHKSYQDWLDQLARDTVKVQAIPTNGYRLIKLNLHALREPQFDPFIKGLMRELGRLPQYEHTPRPKGLYCYADKITDPRIKPPRTKKPSWLGRVLGLFR